MPRPLPRRAHLDDALDVVEVSLAGVDAFDVKRMSLLVRLQARALRRGEKLNLVDVSPSARRALKRAGLRHLVTATGPDADQWVWLGEEAGGGRGFPSR